MSKEHIAKLTSFKINTTCDPKVIEALSTFAKRRAHNTCPDCGITPEYRSHTTRLGIGVMCYCPTVGCTKIYRGIGSTVTKAKEDFLKTI